jgi:thymidylate synthase (FAD)
MKIIDPSYEILTDINRDTVLKHLEKCGRTCYKSEDKITDDSAVKFVSNIVKRNHLAMIEFYDIQVRFIHNRGFCYEMVRHRLCSFAQESTRYCDYEGEGITVIKPYWFGDGIITKPDEETKEAWILQMRQSEMAYQFLREHDLSPQAARGVLPNDVKTEIVVKANLREWKHIFELRCASSAHPDMQKVMIPLRDEITKQLPEIYG